MNQVAATIYARFHRKHLPPGRAVYGVFTRDYQYNTLNSQVITLRSYKKSIFASAIRKPLQSSSYSTSLLPGTCAICVLASDFCLALFFDVILR